MKVNQLYTHEDGSGEIILHLTAEEVLTFFENTARQACQNGDVHFDLFQKD